MTSVPARPPTSVIAGDRVTFRLSLSNYPATSYTASFIVPGLAGSPFTGAEDGTDHLFTIEGATTGGWAAGTYQWWLRVEGAGSPPDVATLQQGAFEVTANPAQATSQTGELQRVITAIGNIEAVLEGRASQDQKRYKIDTPQGGRELERFEPDQLLKLLSYFRSRRRELEAALGLKGRSGRQLVRFGGCD